MSALRVMLDTNMMSELMRNPYGVVASRLEQIGAESACASVLTAAELRYGAIKKGSERLTRDVSASLLRITVMPFEPPADIVYGRIRDHLMRTGTPIGPIDFLIAAHALSLDLILVTANLREFSRVPGLKVENWLD